MLLFTYVGNKDETKDRCKDSKDNLNYGQDICSEGNDQVWTGTPINIPRGSEGVDVIANDFQTQCSGEVRKGNEGKNLKLKQTNRDTLKVTSKELKLWQDKFLLSEKPRLQGERAKSLMAGSFRVNVTVRPELLWYIH